MKKTLVAMAALAATSAFAQTSVTLYGTIDASVQNITRVNGLKNNTSYVDGAISSSVWGLKGSEDLGGGMKANFAAEGDFMSNNGGTHTAGMFRRGLNAGIDTGSMGEITFGLKTNPLIAANGGLVPVGGNTVTTNLATALGYADFYTKNAVTYTSPSIAGLVVQGQHGLSNNALDGSSYGSVTAFNGIYTNGPLKVTGAAQTRREATVLTAISGANATVAQAAAVTADATHLAAAGVSGDSLNKRTKLFGVSYAVNSQLTTAVSRISTKTPATVTTGSYTQAGGAYGAQKNATLVGVGYNMTPTLTLGLNLVKAEDSNFTNVQARYALSKRTSTYAQLSQARNDANGRVNFAPVATNTGTSPAADITDMAATKAKNQSAFGVGIIHSF